MGLAAFRFRNSGHYWFSRRGEQEVAAWLGAISGLLTIAVGVFALWYTSKQVKLGRDQRRHVPRSALGQFLLQLDEAMQRHQAAHLNLRPGGEWHNTTDRPADNEMPAAIAYMGLFERIKIMIDLKLVPANVVNRLYGYRIGNIWVNDRLMCEKLVKLSDQWQDFLELVRCMETERNEEYMPGRWAKYNQLLSNQTYSHSG